MWQMGPPVEPEDDKTEILAPGAIRFPLDNATPLRQCRGA
jgi:hypothetical protein